MSTASEESLGSALSDLDSNPTDEAAWNTAEELARALERPDEISARYRTVLATELSSDDAMRLGRSAVAWHDEWSGEPAALEALLRDVLLHAPKCDWAFERLSMLLTVAARWSELLELYDAAIEAESDDRERRKFLLDEAANAAKNFTDQPERAIRYLELQFALDHGDSQVARALERLYERHGRARDLVTLWTQRLPFLSQDAGHATRARIATTWLDPLGQPAEALRSTEDFLAHGGDRPTAWSLLESVAAAQDPEAARRAIGYLKDQYETARRHDDVIRVLGLALGVTDDATAKASLHRELAERLLSAQRDLDAVPHLAALVELEPDDAEHRDRLEELSTRTNTQEALAVALARGADTLAQRSPDDPSLRLQLLVQAADVRATKLHDEDGAIGLYTVALNTPSAPDSVALPVARRLAALLENHGHDQDRVDVLERLAALEADPEARRATLGQAAKLAERLGDSDRALRSWSARLTDTPNDLEALDATIDLLDRAAHWEPLIESLEARAEVTTDSAVRRADLVRVARTWSDHLGRIDDAITAWSRVRESSGEDPEVVDALAELYTRAERFDDLLELLDRASRAEAPGTRRAALLRRAGEVHLSRHDTASALRAFRESLDADPADKGSRAGLAALLSDTGLHDEAVKILSRAFAATDDWRETLGIVDHRLAATDNPVERAKILCEAADLEEHRAENPEGALGFVARALPEIAAEPERSSVIEAELSRLAAHTNGWQTVVGAYRRAIDAVGDAPRVTALAFRLGSLLESEAGDLPGALVAFSRVAETNHRDLAAAAATVRVAARAGAWSTLASTFIATCQALGTIEPSLVDAVESAIDDDFEGWSHSLAALEATIATAVEASALTPQLARALEATVGVWHRDKRSDDEAAEERLRAAVSHDASDAATLSMLADLQRRAPDQKLIDTLQELGRVLAETPEGLDALHEATTTALDLSDGPQGQVESLLSLLLRQSEARWRTLAPDADARPEELHHARERASWALRHLVDLYADTGRASEAVGLLVAGARMPFTPDEARALRHEAAERAARDVGDAERAMQLYRRILDEAPSDFRAIHALAALYETAGLRSELLELRRTELSLTHDPERRVALRLDIARILDALSDHDAKIATLRDNLAEAPGHGPSVDALESVLSTRGELASVLALFESQARDVAVAGDVVTATALWRRAAALAEGPLSNPPAAINAWEHVAAARDDAEALDHLAQLHADRGDHASAARYLARRLENATGDSRRDTVARLATAQLAVGDTNSARKTLEQGVEEDPSAKTLRSMLAGQYREDEDWERLATLLDARDGAVEPTLDELREAAEVLHQRLQSPDRAVPVLERASTLAPDDRAVRAALADALGGAGRLDEARAMLDGLVESYGRQRPVERAVVHFHLAQLAQARGDTDEALSQLETASSIDMAHPAIFKLLGDLSRSAGQLQRAERAYRALLMIVRRNPPSGAPGASIVPGRPVGPGPSEVLYELHRLAEALGDDDRARETLESAFETAGKSPAEARRFERLLREADEPVLLLRAMETRLSHEDDPARATEVLRAMADHLGGRLGRPADALEALLRALSRSPLDAQLHDLALSRSRELGALDRYAQTLATIVDRARGAGEIEVLSKVALRLARLQEGELDEITSAVKSFEAAEEGAEGESLVEVWHGLDRAYRATGDAEGLARVLRKLIDAESESAMEYAWRLAELQLGAESVATREEGAEWLAWAFERQPDVDRAIPLLRAAVEHSADEGLLALLESIARRSEDDALLLESLERRAALPSVSTDVLREAVALSESLGDEARADALLTRAVAVAQEKGEGSEAVWALVALAERRRLSGALRATAGYLSEAVTLAGPNESFSLALQLGALAAGPLDDLDLAAEVYESLRARDASERAVWEPLMDVYRRRGDTARLEALIDETVANVFELDARIHLRLERARILLARPDRIADAETTLVGALEEDPDNAEATGLLAEVYARLGRDEALDALLRTQFDRARDGSDVRGARELGLRLANRLATNDRAGALEVLREALEVSVSDRELLRRIRSLQHHEDPASERAEVLERLVPLEAGRDASALAIELATLRDQAGDDAGVERALALGFAADPNDNGIRGHLEARYTARDDWAALAGLREHHARHLSEPEARAQGLRAAAMLKRDELGDPAGAAALLGEAREALPEDLGLVAEHSRALQQSGDTATGVATVTAALDAREANDVARPWLLRLRAELHASRGDDTAAAEDLQGALDSGDSEALGELIAALDRQRLRAADDGELEREREATMRLVDVLPRAGQGETAETLLAGWVERAPHDAEALRRVGELHANAERWHDAAAVYQRLVQAEEGAGQVTAALRLAEACERTGRPEDAREGLERAYERNRGDDALRLRLRTLYEGLAMPREAARLWMDDADFASDDDARVERLRRAGETWLDQASDPAQAVTVLEQARSLKATDHETTVLLADAYTAAERLADASQLLNDAITAHRNRRSKELAVLQHRMGRLAYAAADHSVEMAWLNAALDTDPQNGQVAAELADVAMELQQHEIALKALRAVALMKSPGPMSRAMAFLKQGRIAHAQGDSKRAIFLARKSLSEDANLTEAQEFLREIGAE